MKDNDEILVVARRTNKDKFTIYCEKRGTCKPLKKGDHICCKGEKALVELTCLRNAVEDPSVYDKKSGKEIPQWSWPNRREWIKLKFHKSMKIIGFKSLSGFFQKSNFREIDCHNLNTTKTEDMSDMFWGCEYLKKLDLSKFDTSSVTDMSHMFFDCVYLGKLNLSKKFDTSSVTDMTQMFCGCKNLTRLNLSKFDTSSVTDMSGVFQGCELLWIPQ